MMNTTELALLLTNTKVGSTGQPLRVVCLDDGECVDVNVTLSKIDAKGNLVTSFRLEVVASQKESLDRAEQELVYNDPDSIDYWHSRYPTFEAFYDFMESSRLTENALVEYAVDVAVLHAGHACM